MHRAERFVHEKCLLLQEVVSRGSSCLLEKPWLGTIHPGTGPHRGKVPRQAWDSRLTSHGSEVVVEGSVTDNAEFHPSAGISRLEEPASIAGFTGCSKSLNAHKVVATRE